MDDNNKIDLNNLKADDVQFELEDQIEQASVENDGTQKTDFEEKISKDGEGATPDLGTAKDQMNSEPGIEIL